MNAFQSAAQKSRRKKLGHIDSLYEQSLYLIQETKQTDNEDKCNNIKNETILKKIKRLEKVECFFQSYEVQKAEKLFEKILRRRCRSISTAPPSSFFHNYRKVTSTPERWDIQVNLAPT